MAKKKAYVIDTLELDDLRTMQNSMVGKLFHIIINDQVPATGISLSEMLAIGKVVHVISDEKDPDRFDIEVEWLPGEPRVGKEIMSFDRISGSVKEVWLDDDDLS